MYYKDSFGSSSQKSKEKASSNPAFFKDKNAAIQDIAPKNVILEMYSLATDEPFSFLTIRLTAKNKNDIFMIRYDKNSNSIKKDYDTLF